MKTEEIRKAIIDNEYNNFLDKVEKNLKIMNNIKPKPFKKLSIVEILKFSILLKRLKTQVNKCRLRK